MPEVERLWVLHWKETEGYRDSLGYNPDKEAFLAYDQQGMFRLYTARDNGRLIGQVGFIAAPCRHTQKKSAWEDFFYLTEEARGAGVATKLLRFALQDLRDEGFEHVTASEKLDDNVKRLFEKVGFKFVARAYSLIFKEV